MHSVKKRRVTTTGNTNQPLTLTHKFKTGCHLWSHGRCLHYLAYTVWFNCHL